MGSPERVPTFEVRDAGFPEAAILSLQFSGDVYNDVSTTP